jgi:uncharacterized protein (TIGR02466 family)
MAIDALFVTKLYKARLGGSGERALLQGLARACLAIAADDSAGQAWCAKNRYAGYTSYGSLTDLAWRDPDFGALADRLDAHVAAFQAELDFDLGGRAIVRDHLWINILPEGGGHSGHIHPHSVISGSFYVAIPKGASAIRFEDPRLARMMAAPPRKKRAGLDNRSFVEVAPAAGMVLLWESWLRHEVAPNEAEEARISISFNYRWGKRGGL